MHNPIWKILWRLVTLTALVSQAATPADSAPRILVIAPPATNHDSSALNVSSFSADGRQEIAELRGQGWYGIDEDSAAFLQINGPHSAGARLLVINRKTLDIIADKTLHDIHPGLLKATIADQLAVHSQTATVVFQVVDAQGFGFIEAKWKIGATPRLPGDRLGYPVAWLPIPSGVVVSTFHQTAAYDASTHKQVLLLDRRGDDSIRGQRQVYYLPTLGLMEYYNGTHLQFTDTNLSTAIPNPEHFPTTKITGKIFVRNTDGKPFLIWGENKELNNPRTPPTGITEIVIFDPISKKELLRQPLGHNFSADFQPDQTGMNIYFIEPKSGKIFCLNWKTQTISPFANTGLQSLNESNLAIVAAD
ncbi:hypothetical protein [Pedosphaera parvula]|uniref:Phytase-like domain-containing protein n=1 Tax=Pedosphaera parvula (strain Ellin514) TaxID=320771 RepID=B9XM27_PEDPL|nr:hypothetical protein [Pedosphaera parvula]EEF59155.1 hypothetical protein Cflav_PD1647 [Pedosphaera parvula Ellin514]